MYLNLRILSQTSQINTVLFYLQLMSLRAPKRCRTNDEESDAGNIRTIHPPPLISDSTKGKNHLILILA